MIVRSPQPTAAASGSAQRLARQKADFTAEGAPPPVATTAPMPASPPSPAGPPRRKRWLHEQHR